MKTTMHLHRPPTSPVRVEARAVTSHVRPATVRLGIALSVAAALITVVLDLPALAILLPVIVVGFVLSWIACGRPLLAARPSDRANDDPPT